MTKASPDCGDFGFMTDTILVTGGLGFIGSHFVDYFLGNNPSHSIVNVDKQTYAANLDFKVRPADAPRYTSIKADICNGELMDYLFAQYQFSGVVNFAAESHVDNSIRNPESFVTTNIYGTYVLLEASKKYAEQNRGDRFRFHHISTDEVFGSLGQEGFFREESRYMPNSPYSASKAASDHLVRSYHHTFGLNTVITNCSNNFGPRQHKEKFIPTIIRHALQGSSIPVYGNGRNVRDWLYVEDHCRALELAFLEGAAGETYNIGGDCELENIDLAEKICQKLDELKPRADGGSYTSQITFVKDRQGHDHRYAIDARKIREQLAWSRRYSLDQALDLTISWYLENFMALES